MDLPERGSVPLGVGTGLGFGTSSSSCRMRRTLGERADDMADAVMCCELSDLEGMPDALADERKCLSSVDVVRPPLE